jgi:hypothetical protein
VSAYAGIGSRAIPEEALRLIASIAKRLAQEEAILRTGLSPGADQAFYRGALAGDGEVELYLPWPGFQARALSAREHERVRVLSRPTPAAYALAARFHPADDGRPFAALTDQAQARLARDSHEVLGADLHSPVACVICWTPDGNVDGRTGAADGTSQALRIAAERAVPVFNLARAEHVAEVQALRLAASAPLA